MADEITIASLTKSIEEILEDADLDQLTSKKVRRQLEAKYEIDLLTRKDEIDEVLMRLLNERQKHSSDEDEDPSSDESEQSSEGDKAEVKKRKSSSNQDKKPIKKAKKKADSDSDDSMDRDEELAKQLSDDGSRLRERKTKRKKKKEKSPSETKPKRKTGYVAEMILTPELAEIMGAPKMARSDVVKKMWQVIKERELQDPKDKRFTKCDEQLEKVIGRKRFLTFGMMKHLNRHLSEDPDRPKKPPKEPKKEGEEGQRSKGGYGAEVTLSDSLADLMGKQKMARSDVVKKMWEIIRERNLQDPGNRKFTICDEQLENIIGEKRFQTFGMMKYLKNHMS